MKFPKGVSGNPGGKRPLPPEIKAMREAALSMSIAILHARIHDARYMAKLRPMELAGFLSLAFDRCGLPKVTQSELAGPDGEALTVKIVSFKDSFEKKG